MIYLKNSDLSHYCHEIHNFLNYQFYKNLNKTVINAKKFRIYFKYNLSELNLYDVLNNYYYSTLFFITQKN